MARLDRFSAFSDSLRRLFYGIPNRRARRELGRNPSSTRPADSSRRRVRPCLEMLEDRITPTTFTPTVFTDGVSGNGQINTLRDAILASNADTGTATDTIQLQAGTYTLSIANTNGHDTSGKQGDLNIGNISHTLVIQGAENSAGNPTTTIDQTVVDRVFQILNPGTTVIFKNLIIEGGEAVDNGASGAVADTTEADGGGILDDGGNVTLSNVILQKNSADAGTGFNANGGGVYVASGGSLTVEDSEIEADGAFAGGAAVGSTNNGGSASGGGIFSLGSTSIGNSTVSNNLVTGGNGSSGNVKSGDGGNAEGGGVYAVGPTTITDSTLSGNTLTAGSTTPFGFGGFAEGGSVWLGAGQTSKLTITGSTLSGNTLNAGSGGAGGDADGGSVFATATTTITDSILSDNTLNGGLGNSSRDIGGVTDVGGDAIGGGVYAFTGSPLTISASTLSGNILKGGQGLLSNTSSRIAGNVGGSAEGGGVFDVGSTTITTSTLANNTLTGGAGSYVTGSFSAEGSSIGGSASGGGLFCPGGTVTISASTLSGNTVTGGSGSGSSNVTVPGLAQGGGASFAGATATLVNSTIDSNQVIGGQGVNANSVVAGGGLFFASTVTATLTNDTVAENNAQPSSGEGATDGGGIDNAGGIVTLVNTLVAQNFATTGPDYFGSVSNSDHNLIGKADGSTGFSAAHGDQFGSIANPLNPGLGTLGNNGGPTQTIALLAGSPAINAGDNNAESVTGQFDQRGQGFSRVVDGTIDIGAFEVQPPTSPPPSGSSPPSASPPPPPTLQTPPLLAFFNAFLGGGVETLNANGTVTVTDRFFGFPLLVSTFASNGDLESVTFFGLNLTALFELPL